jgi:predicted phosphodiesterase
VNEPRRRWRSFVPGSPSAEVLVCGHTHHAALFTREGGFQLVNGPSDCGLLPAVIV